MGYCIGLNTLEAVGGIIVCIIAIIFVIIVKEAP